MDLALAARPGAAEIAGVLTACVVVFLLLVRFDGDAARDEASRARTELAKRAAAAREPVPARETRRAGDESLGDAGPISVPVSSAWSAGTSPVAGHARVDDAPFRPSNVVLGLLGGAGAVLALAGSLLIVRTRG